MKFIIFIFIFFGGVTFSSPHDYEKNIFSYLEIKGLAFTNPLNSPSTNEQPKAANGNTTQCTEHCGTSKPKKQPLTFFFSNLER